MLLNFHITDKARQHLLYQLWDRAVSRAKDVFNAMYFFVSHQGDKSC